MDETWIVYYNLDWQQTSIICLVLARLGQLFDLVAHQLTARRAFFDVR